MPKFGLKHVHSKQKATNQENISSTPLPVTQLTTDRLIQTKKAGRCILFDKRSFQGFAIDYYAQYISISIAKESFFACNMAAQGLVQSM